MKDNAAHDDCSVIERNLFSSLKKAQGPGREIAFRLFSIAGTTENIRGMCKHLHVC